MSIKEQGKSFGINQLLMYATLIPILWFVGKPVMMDAMAEDIKGAVQTEIEPISNAFVALLQRDINSTKKSIAALKFRERSDPEWSQLDAEYLADLEIQLAALEEAKSALQDAN